MVSYLHRLCVVNTLIYVIIRGYLFVQQTKLSPYEKH